MQKFLFHITLLSFQECHAVRVRYELSYAFYPILLQLKTLKLFYPPFIRREFSF